MLAFPHSGALRRSLLPYLIVLLVIALGMGATVTVWWALGSLNALLLRDEFNDTARDCAHVLQRSLARDEEALLGVRAFHLASRSVERAEFDRFTSLLLKRHPEISALLWLPRVSPAARSAFESGLRAEGLSNPRVRDIGGTGALRIAADRADLFPILYIEPYIALAASCGLNLASLPGCRAAMTRARLQETPVATRWNASPLPALSAGDSHAPCFILFAPVLVGEGSRSSSPYADPLQDPRLAGFMAAIVRIDLLIESNLKTRKAMADIDLAVFDVVSEPPLYQTTQQTIPSGTAGASLRFTESLDPGGWPWSVVFSAKPDYAGHHDSPTGPLVLAGGGLCTLLIGVLLFVRILREEEKALLAATLARANEELREANLRLMELDSLRNDFVSSASHELRTPVAILQGVIENLEIAGRRSGQDEPMRQLQQMARRNIDRLSFLVQQLLESSRLQSGSLSLVLAEADLTEVVGEAAANMRIQADRARVTLLVELPDTPTPVHLDVNRIIQVLLNLLDNAIRFARSRVRVTLQCVDGVAELVVEDDGPGVSTAELPLLFKRFTRLPSADSRSHIGLGLSIVKAIVEQHGGRVRAENRPGGGLRLTVHLPLVDR